MRGSTQREGLWVLRNARLHAVDTAVRSASAFAAGNGRARPVHRAQVGRWENGTVGLTHELVRRYETVLGLPEGQLTTAIDFFTRAQQPVRTAATLSPDIEPDVDATLGLVERALGSNRMSGLDWNRLSDNIGRMPHVILRAEDWAALMHRCLRETDVSHGLEWAMRTEAVARLAGHPRSGSAVAQLATDVLADPSAQLYTEAVSLLQYTTHPEAVDVLLGQLRRPTNEHALRAALMAVSAQLRGGRLTEPATLDAVRRAAAALRDSSSPPRLHRGVARLLNAIEAGATTSVAPGLSIATGRLPTAPRTGLYRRLGQSVAQDLTQADRDDPVLECLVAEALSDPNEEDRGTALAILMLSPQGRVVGRAVGRELAAAARARDDVAMAECLALLSYLGQPEDLDTLTDLAVAPDTPPDRVLECAVVIGNCPDLDEAAGLARVERIRARLADLVVGDAPEPALRGLTYLLGMRGRFDLISDLAAELTHHHSRYAAESPPVSPRGPAVAGATLGWWLDLPEHLRPQPTCPRELAS